LHHFPVSFRSLFESERDREAHRSRNNFCYYFCVHIGQGISFAGVQLACRPHLGSSGRGGSARSQEFVRIVHLFFHLFAPFFMFKNIPFSTFFRLFSDGSVAYFFRNPQSATTHLVVFSWLPWLCRCVEEGI
jgi:hypothetical protein